MKVVYAVTVCGSLSSFAFCRHINIDTIVINKLCKLNFRYFTMFLVMSAAGLIKSCINLNNMVCY